MARVFPLLKTRIPLEQTVFPEKFSGREGSVSTFGNFWVQGINLERRDNSQNSLLEQEGIGEKLGGTETANLFPPNSEKS